KYVEAQIELFESETHEEVPQELQQEIRDMLMLHPDHTRVHYLSYLYYAQHGDWEQAERSLRHYFDTYQSFDGTGSAYQYALLNLAILNIRFGLVTEARKVLEEAKDMARDSRDNICLLYLASWEKRLELGKPTILPLPSSENARSVDNLGRDLEALSIQAVRERAPQVQALTELQIAMKHIGSGKCPTFVFEALAKATALCYCFDLKLQASIALAVANAWHTYGKQ
ncbi:hypothetical protein EV182_005304, partial [Spiromyces aspiralis]